MSMPCRRRPVLWSAPDRRCTADAGRAVIITISTQLLIAIGTFLGGVAAASGLLWGAVIKPLRATREQVKFFLEDWHGEPARPGVDERPGVMVRMRRQEEAQVRTDATLEEIRSELKTNGGGSLKDAVRSIQKSMNNATVIALPSQPDSDST